MIVHGLGSRKLVCCVWKSLLVVMTKEQHITRVYEWKTKHDYFLCWKKEDADDEEVVRKHQNVIWQMMIEDAEVEKKTNEETGEVEVLVLVEVVTKQVTPTMLEDA